METSWERSRGRPTMNQGEMKHLFIEWLKEEGDPRTDSHPMKGIWLPFLQEEAQLSLPNPSRLWTQTATFLALWH